MCQDKAMSCGTGRFAAGMVAGFVTGAAVGIVMSPSRRELKRTANNAVRYVNHVVGQLSDSLGM